MIEQARLGFLTTVTGAAAAGLGGTPQAQAGEDAPVPSRLDTLRPICRPELYSKA
jgi:hypothetical protein